MIGSQPQGRFGARIGKSVLQILLVEEAAVSPWLVAAASEKQNKKISSCSTPE